MAFLKTAYAQVIYPHVTRDRWSEIRTAGEGAHHQGTLAGNLVERATEMFQQNFQPGKYLMTHCFPAGHKVLMADGTEKPIEMVRVGERVITHRGNVRPVTHLFQKEVDEDLTVIKAASLPDVSCTKGHPFYAIREQDSWCQIYPSYQGHVKCTFGGKKVCARHSCLTNGSVPEWVEAGNLHVGDRTYTPTLNRTRVVDGLNPNRMRLLGYYVAEGRVDLDCRRKQPYSIRFALHDRELKTLGVEISRLMRLEFGIQSHSVIKNKKRAAAEGDLGVVIAFHSFEHAPWFLKHGGLGSRTKRLSEEVVQAPAQWQRYLMGSWINGDGCYDALSSGVGGNNGIRLSTTSDALASQATVILDRLGIYSRLQRYVSRRRQIRGRWIAESRGWHVDISASYAHYLSDVVKWAVQKNPKKRLSTKQRYRYAASTISRVVQLGHRSFQGLVYNLSVEGDESYIINRQAVHNCTIIASVDVFEPSGVKIGSVLEGGVQVNRKFADYRVTPSTQKYINNNYDFWSRPVLLASYPTFVGAHNFVEHVQIEDLSKGRVIDAVARDIGDSVYVDILIATDRQHRDLITAIENGKMATLSMGCVVDGTSCTRCGHWAADETEMCDHIKYSKGNVFYDEQGRQHVIAESCGHPSIDPHAGVQFVDASWVAAPAFTGAVLRNILEPNDEISRRAQEILATPPPQWSADAVAKAASTGTGEMDAALAEQAARQGIPVARIGKSTRQKFTVGGPAYHVSGLGSDEDLFLAGWADEGGDEEGGEGGEGDAPADKPASPLKGLEEELAQHMMDRVKKRIREDMRGDVTDEALEDSSMAPNDSIIKEGKTRLYLAGLDSITKTATSDVALIDGVAAFNRRVGVHVPVPLYRAALKVGRSDKYKNLRAFCTACVKALGRRPQVAEARTILRLGKLLTRRETLGGIIGSRQGGTQWNSESV